MKALGTGWGRGAGWTEVEVVRPRSGSPEIRLTGKAAETARKKGIRRLHLSLSHTAALALAVVVAET